MKNDEIGKYFLTGIKKDPVVHYWDSAINLLDKPSPSLS